MPHSDQILTAQQVRDAEQLLIDAGETVGSLMQTAGRGAAEWVWRLAARHRVTVLCGPGNNGGDGYVIAETLRERGGNVAVVVGGEPSTAACREARARYQGPVLDVAEAPHGEVLVDCLFGTGLTRPLSPQHAGALADLAALHPRRIAVDLPSGVQADSGMVLNDGLPAYDLTLALGAWKFAHFLMPAAARMGRLQRVGIGLAAVTGAATAIGRPVARAPAADAHKYKRGLLAVVSGAMPGAAVLASVGAQGAGAGYVKLFAESKRSVPMDVVVEQGPLTEVLTDDRNAAILVGPGLGRDASARERLAIALADPVPVVLDADALVLLGSRQLAERQAATIATPHEGEFVALERAFGLDGVGTRAERARALALASGMIVVAKGPDTLVADPEGRLACASRASSWLSTAGTGDVLAGIIASRVASGVDAFEAACQGVWLHGEAARLCPPAFTAGQLAQAVPAALAACL